MKSLDNSLPGMQQETSIRGAELLKASLIIAARFITKRVKLFESAESNIYRNYQRIHDNGDFAKSIPVKRLDYSRLEPYEMADQVAARAQPLHFPGFALGSPAVKLWDTEYFAENYGDDIIPAIDGDHYDKITVRDAVSMIKSGSGTHQKYIQAVANVFCSHRELFDHLPMSQIFALQRSGFHGAEMFMGAKGTGSPWHCANEWTFFVNITGKKEWHFIRPEFTIKMQPFFQRDLIYVVSGFGHNNPPDITTYTVTLNPGDLLVFPAWWWHRVANLSDETIGIAVRFRTLMQQIKSANPTLSILQLTTLQQWKNILLERTTGRLKDDERYLWRALKMIG